MSAKEGVSRINAVLTILGWIWSIGCQIKGLVFDMVLVVYGGMLLRDMSSWDVFLLLLPGLKWCGIGLAGLVVAKMLTWILEGFVDD
jgi:hypothetical protein